MFYRVLMCWGVLLLLGCQPVGDSGHLSHQLLEFKQLARGMHSKQIQPARYGVKDKKSWARLQNLLAFPTTDLVNFDQDRVLAVFQGQKPSGGFLSRLQR